MVYLARAIPVFIMYCVNGASRSSLLIKSTDSMIRTGIFGQTSGPFFWMIGHALHDLSGCLFH